MATMPIKAPLQDVNLQLAQGRVGVAYTRTHAALAGKGDNLITPQQPSMRNGQAQRHASPGELVQQDI